MRIPSVSTGGVIPQSFHIILQLFGDVVRRTEVAVELNNQGAQIKQAESAWTKNVPI